MDDKKSADATSYSIIGCMHTKIQIGTLLGATFSFGAIFVFGGMSGELCLRRMKMQRNKINTIYGGSSEKSWAFFNLPWKKVRKSQKSQVRIPRWTRREMRNREWIY